MIPAPFFVLDETMLYRELLQKELEDRREDFLGFSAARSEELEKFIAAARCLAAEDPEDLASRIARSSQRLSIPSAEPASVEALCVPFGREWRNHEEARKWAAEVLETRTTFAADGSQLYSERETSLPVAAVQIGWFENPHSSGSDYRKGAEFRVLTPDILLDRSSSGLTPESRIGEMRFHMEVERVAAFVREAAGWRDRGERMPLAFFDGTLLISFSLPQTDLQKTFIESMVELVRLSKECAVPVVGYVDRSLARDVIGLLSWYKEKLHDAGEYVTDATLFSASDSNGRPLLKHWGDRTSFFLADRAGMESFRDPRTGGPLIGFCYLLTSGTGLPARLDIPAWVREEGLLDELVDTVRAECVIGLGYPYPIEAADATALISNRDRQVFLRALQEFAERERLDFNVTAKPVSKARRR